MNLEKKRQRLPFICVIFFYCFLDKNPNLELPEDAYRKEKVNKLIKMIKNGKSKGGGDLIFRWQVLFGFRFFFSNSLHPRLLKL